MPVEAGPLPILVVDDEPAIRRTLSWALAGDGHPVTVAHDVASAITALEKSHFAAILTDLQMPGGVGLALVDEVERRRLRTPVVLMSGSLAGLDGSDPRIGRLAGMRAKAFDLQALRSNDLRGDRALAMSAPGPASGRTTGEDRWAEGARRSGAAEQATSGRSYAGGEGAQEEEDAAARAVLPASIHPRRARYRRSGTVAPAPKGNKGRGRP